MAPTPERQKDSMTMKSVTTKAVAVNTVDAPEIKKSNSLTVVTPKAAEDGLDREPVDFDWSDPDAEILPQQPRTAAYFDVAGSLVIRQQNWPDEDSVIIIASASVDTFIDKLCDVIGIPSFGGPAK
jgi:hypothetical protein